VIPRQLAQAFEVIREHNPAKIVTLGGECAVSVAPFAELARRYADDLAIISIDSNPDIGTPASEYPGFHAMAVAALTGHGDPDVLHLLPATVPGDRVALAGLHAWTDDDIGDVAEWGIRSFSPEDLRATTQPLLDWLARTGCSRVAIHFDVDTVDSNEIVLGLVAFLWFVVVLTTLLRRVGLALSRISWTTEVFLLPYGLFWLWVLVVAVLLILRGVTGRPQRRTG
jgi:arginase